MGLLMDTIKSFADMKKLSGLTDAIETEIKQLDSEGKLPDELKTAFETLQNNKGTSGGSVEDSLKPLQEFITVLEKYEDLFPENIKNIVSKIEGVEKDLEGIAGDFDNLNKK